MKTKEEVIKKLQDPNLLINIIKEVKSEGVVGEENTIVVLTIKVNLRYCKGVHKPSQNIIVSSKPGYGKDEVVTSTLKVIVAKGEYIHRTDLSDKAMLYFGLEYPDWSWDGKVMYIEDPKDNTTKTASFKTLATGETSASTVIDQKYVDLKINGKPVLIITSFKETVDIEGERRWGIIHTNESKELTAVCNKEYAKKVSSREEFDKPKDATLRKALQTKLKPYDVIIPFFDKVLEKINFSNRYYIKNLADYIKGNTILHQYQRNKDKNGRLIATFFDWDVGLFVFNQLHAKINSSLNSRELELVNFLAEHHGIEQPYSAIEENTKISKQWLYNNEDRLKERGIVKIKYVDLICGSTYKPVKHLYLPEGSVFDDIPTSNDFIRFLDDIKTILKTKYMIDFNDINTFSHTHSYIVQCNEHVPCVCVDSHKTIKIIKSTIYPQYKIVGDQQQNRKKSTVDFDEIDDDDI